MLRSGLRRRLLLDRLKRGQRHVGRAVAIPLLDLHEPQRGLAAEDLLQGLHLGRDALDLDAVDLGLGQTDGGLVDDGLHLVALPVHAGVDREVQQCDAGLLVHGLDDLRPHLVEDLELARLHVQRADRGHVLGEHGACDLDDAVIERQLQWRRLVVEARHGAISLRDGIGPHLVGVALRVLLLDHGIHREVQTTDRAGRREAQGLVGGRRPRIGVGRKDPRLRGAGDLSHELIRAEIPAVEAALDLADGDLAYLQQLTILKAVALSLVLAITEVNHHHIVGRGHNHSVRHSTGRNRQQSKGGHTGIHQPAANSREPCDANKNSRDNPGCPVRHFELEHLVANINLVTAHALAHLAHRSRRPGSVNAAEHIVGNHNDAKGQHSSGDNAHPSLRCVHAALLCCVTIPAYNRHGQENSLRILLTVHVISNITYSRSQMWKDLYVYIISYLKVFYIVLTVL